MAARQDELNIGLEYTGSCLPNCGPRSTFRCAATWKLSSPVNERLTYLLVVAVFAWQGGKSKEGLCSNAVEVVFGGGVVCVFGAMRTRP